MVKKKINTIIIGFGSIGFRHAKNLIKLGLSNIDIFRTFKNKTKFKISKKINIIKNLPSALDNKKYDLMILSNPTSEHVKYALKGAKKKINLYIEKPLSNNLNNTSLLKKLEKLNKIKIIIGCQLRYHPGLIFIKKFLKSKKLGKIYSVFCDVGEHLPFWHPYENYKKSYASKKKLGGGVVLTLIHEIDYLYWLFGKFKSVYANGGSLTKLNIDVEDTVVGNIHTLSNIPISLRMDYWRNPPTRQLNIVGEKGQIFWDYYKKSVMILFNNKKIIKKKLSSKWNRNLMFRDILKDFITNSLFKKTKPKISLSESIYVLKTALALKKSLKNKKKIFI